MKTMTILFSDDATAPGGRSRREQGGCLQVRFQSRMSSGVDQHLPNFPNMVVYPYHLFDFRLTPLHHIAMRGNRDLMQLLLNEELNLNARDLQVRLML